MTGRISQRKIPCISTLFILLLIAVSGLHLCGCVQTTGYDDDTLPSGIYTSSDGRQDTASVSLPFSPLRFSDTLTRNSFAAPDSEARRIDACDAAAAITVATFNIRYDNGFGTGDNAWNHPDIPRRDCVISLINDIDPDLLGVQEALLNQMNDLSDELSGYSSVGCGRDDGDEQGEYAALFYRNDRFSLHDSGFFWLSTTPDVPGTVFSGSGSVRLATWIIISDELTGHELFALNTHWDNVSQSSREQSARLIREKCGSLSHGLPVIVMGDLNQDETNKAITILLAEADEPEQTLIDAYRQVHPARQPDERTYHAFEGTTTGSRIDFIFLDSRLSATDAVIRTDRCGGRYPSDHYPVTATLEWTHHSDGTPCTSPLSVIVH